MNELQYFVYSLQYELLPYYGLEIFHLEDLDIYNNHNLEILYLL